MAAEDEVTVVFDGRPDPGEADAAADCGVTTHFAPGGPNAADDAIVETVRADARPETLVVVTSDADLTHRVEELGAAVIGVQAFRERLAR